MITFNIKQLKALNNISQQELIDKSAIRASTLSAYENSKAKTISIEHIDRLCTLLNCQPSDLMTFTPNPDLSEMEIGDLFNQQLERASKISKQAEDIISIGNRITSQLHNK